MNKSRWQALRSPLSRHVVVAIILFSTLIALATTGLQIYWEYKNSIDDVEHDIAQIETVHIKALTQSLWTTNYNNLILQLEGLVLIQNIKHAAVYEGEHLWAEAGRRTHNNVIERNFPLTLIQDNVPRTLGTLSVIASLDAIYDHLFEQALVILLSNGLKTFLVSGFILILIYRLINRHLLAITSHVATLDLQHNATPLVLKRHPRNTTDEFDLLVAAINDMQEKVHTAINERIASEYRFHAIADYTVDWENWVAPDGHIIWVNPSVTRLTGYTPEECLAMPDFPLCLVNFQDAREHLRSELTKTAQGGSGDNFEFELRRKDGEKRWALISWQPIYGKDNEFLGHRSSVRDLSERKRMELELHDKVIKLEQSEVIQRHLAALAQQEQARMTSLLSAMNIGILFEDFENRIVYFNPAFRRIWLIPDDVKLQGLTTKDIVGMSTNVLARPDLFSKHMLQVLGTHEVSDTYEIILADGRVITQLSYPIRADSGNSLGRLWIYEDITRARQTADQLIYLAERDSLTGLYNRHRFQDELSRMLADAGRRKSQGALLFFDLDEFKYINDTFGHRAGDSMLIRVAGAVHALVRRNEVISRIGGDEFAMLLPDASEAEAAQVADRVIRAISQIPFRFEGQNLRLTTSLGIALYPAHGANAEELVSHADAAMYQAKEAGKNAWRVYRQDLDASREMLHRLSWNDRIGNALENNLLRLHYQGVYHGKSGELTHLEALIRMRDEHDTELVVMPGHFIPAIEKTNKILEVDRWVIRESISLLKRLPHLPALAINISGRSFDEPTLPHFINEQLSSLGVSPRRLLVELTETSAVSDLHDAQRFIEALRQTGCRVCLDDFGTGFSSFAYLKHLNVDTLKIDGMFIRDLPNDRDNQVFVKSIVDVARGMHKTTVAEFVEDAETLAMLKSFGVDMMQGYHLDMPRENHPALDFDNTFFNA
ncbi:MAG: EAL domain-containing protein [Gammaproteobacteria bacterium]|nr:EAL domain-containing protein [Gammaproteobacteria bacterium]